MQTRLGSALAPFLLGLCAAAILGGCAGSQDRSAENRQACVNAGYKPGTDSFTNCMMQSDTQRSKATADRQTDKNQPPDAEVAVPIPAPVSKGCQTTESTEVKGAATQAGQTTSTRTSSVCGGQ